MNRKSTATFAKAPNGIPGRQGDTLGIGDVTLYGVRDGQLYSLGETVQAHNAASGAVEPNKLLILLDIDGVLVVDWEEAC